MAGKRSESGAAAVMVIVALVTVAAIVGVAVFLALNADKITSGGAQGTAAPAAENSVITSTTGRIPDVSKGGDPATTAAPPATEPVTAAPPVSDKPVTVPPPVTEGPVTVTEPEITEEPQMTEGPEITEEPQMTEGPATTEGSVTTEEPEITEEPVIVPDPVINSGSFYGSAPKKENGSAVGLRLYVEWESSYIEGEDGADLTVRVYIESYSLSVSSRSENTITVNGTQYTYDTSRVSVTGSSKKQTLLHGQTFRTSVNGDGTVDLGVMWKYSGTYSGVSITRLTASDKIKVY